MLWSYYRGKTAQSITARICLSLALFVLIAPVPANGHRLTRIYIRRGAFNEAYNHVRDAASQVQSQQSVARLGAIAREIDMASGPLSTHEREHLLRLALEAILDAGAGVELSPALDLEQIAPVLEPVLIRFDSFESPQLRRACIDLGARLLDSAEWRSALQRRGHQLIAEQQEAGGLTDGDTTAELIALVDALAHTGDSRMITLIDTLRRGSQRRETVRAARSAIDRLDASR